jgi:phosphate transport system permease protein
LNEGLLNSIIGTFYVTILSVVLATPVALGTAIYLKKYTGDNLAVRIVQILIDILSGTPSIVLGVFGMIFLCVYLKPITGGYSLLACSIALAILIMPVIEKASEDAIRTVPEIIEEGSYALGATKWNTIKNITVPYAVSGIVTGIILAAGRASEESAIVLLTASYSENVPIFKIVPDSSMLFGIRIFPLNVPIGVLPISIYDAFNNGGSSPNLFATALILIIIVMAINAVARIIVWRWKIG